MRYLKYILLQGGWRDLAGRFCKMKWVVGGILGVEILGIALCYWQIRNYNPDSVLKADYEAVIENQDKVRDELNRLETSKEEDLYVLEAMTGLMSALPEQVKLREITIGDFHNGDWIVLEVASDDMCAIENYLGTLRQNPKFEEMRIADTDAGVRVTVPMPEGFIWH